MSKTFFDSKCWHEGDEIALTEFCGPSLLKSRRCMQLSVKGQQFDGQVTIAYISLTEVEVEQLRDQLNRYLDNFENEPGYIEEQEFDASLVGMTCHT